MEFNTPIVFLHGLILGGILTAFVWLVTRK